MAESNVKITINEGSLDLSTAELELRPNLGGDDLYRLVVRKGGLYWYETKDTTKTRVKLDWVKFKELMDTQEKSFI